MTEIKRKNRADKRKYHFVYKTTCIVTNKWYLGMHSTDDLDDGYLGSGTILSRSVKKYGRDKHVMEILFIFETRSEAAEREHELITEDVRRDPMCMNIQQGGQGAHLRPDHTEDSKAKMSEASKKFWETLKADPIAYAEHISKTITPESVAKRAAANTGKKRADTTKMKAAAKKSADAIPFEIKQERSLRASATMAERGSRKGGRPKGTAMSAEQRAAQSKAMVNNPNSVAKIRVSCMHCRKETSLSGLSNFHKHE